MSAEEARKNEDVKTLDLSFQKLHTVPSYVWELSSLESLNLSHNQLTVLPKDITKLKSLKNLDISWNHILHDVDFVSENIKVNHAWNR